MNCSAAPAQNKVASVSSNKGASPVVILAKTRIDGRRLKKIDSGSARNALSGMTGFHRFLKGTGAVVILVKTRIHGRRFEKNRFRIRAQRAVRNDGFSSALAGLL
jgi:hypothetical protein